MNQSVMIIGSGGHARSLIALLHKARFSVSGVYDDSYDPRSDETIAAVPILGSLSDVPAHESCLLAVGDNQKRYELYNQYAKNILTETVIHPDARIQDGISLGKSNQIFGAAYLNYGVELGENNIINTAAILEHEVIVGSHCHLSVGSIVCGRTKIGNMCFLGAGAVLIDGIRIADRVTIGANSVVIKDIDEPGTYAGNPARKISE